MIGPERVRDEMARIFDTHEGLAPSSSRPHVVPAIICVRCRQVVSADEGTHELVGSRWYAVHRGPCPEPAA